MIAGFNRQIDAARQRLQGGTSTVIAVQAAHPLTIEEVAALNYREQLELDEEFLDFSSTYSNRSINHGYVAEIRGIASGKAHDNLILQRLGSSIE